ncbi:uncharacterized protein LOC135469603 isoform X2 [Liolophura sinensis]
MADVEMTETVDDVAKVSDPVENRDEQAERLVEEIIGNDVPDSTSTTEVKVSEEMEQDNGNGTDEKEDKTEKGDGGEEKDGDEEEGDSDAEKGDDGNSGDEQPDGTEGKAKKKRNKNAHVIYVYPVKLKDLVQPKLSDFLATCFFYSIHFVECFQKGKMGVLEVRFQGDKPPNLEELQTLLNNFKVESGQCPTLRPWTLADAKKNKLAAWKEENEAPTPEGDQEEATVYIENLPPVARPEMLKFLYPRATQVEIPTDTSGESLGHALLKFATTEEAKAVVKNAAIYNPKIGKRYLAVKFMDAEGQIHEEPLFKGFDLEAEERKNKHRRYETQESYDDGWRDRKKKSRPPKHMRKLLAAQKEKEAESGKSEGNEKDKEGEAGYEDSAAAMEEEEEEENQGYWGPAGGGWGNEEEMQDYRNSRQNRRNDRPWRRDRDMPDWHSHQPDRRRGRPFERDFGWQPPRGFGRGRRGRDHRFDPWNSYGEEYEGPPPPHFRGMRGGFRPRPPPMDYQGGYGGYGPDDGTYDQYGDQGYWLGPGDGFQRGPANWGNEPAGPPPPPQQKPENPQLDKLKGELMDQLGKLASGDMTDPDTLSRLAEKVREVHTGDKPAKKPPQTEPKPFGFGNQPFKDNSVQPKPTAPPPPPPSNYGTQSSANAPASYTTSTGAYNTPTAPASNNSVWSTGGYQQQANAGGYQQQASTGGFQQQATTGGYQQATSNTTSTTGNQSTTDSMYNNWFQGGNSAYQTGYYQQTAGDNQYQTGTSQGVYSTPGTAAASTTAAATNSQSQYQWGTDQSQYDWSTGQSQYSGTDTSNQSGYNYQQPNASDTVGQSWAYTSYQQASGGYGQPAAYQTGTGNQSSTASGSAPTYQTPSPASGPGRPGFEKVYRQLCVKNLPESLGSMEIKAFFDDMMVKNGLTDTKPTVASVSVGPKVTFIEFLTDDFATKALTLNGIFCLHKTLKIERTNRYKSLTG